MPPICQTWQMTLEEYMRRFSTGSVSDRLREIAKEYEQHLDSQHILQNSRIQLVIRRKIDTLQQAADQLEDKWGA